MAKDKDDAARAQGFTRGLKGKGGDAGMTEGWTDDKTSSVARNEGWIAGKRKRSQVAAETERAKRKK